MNSMKKRYSLTGQLEVAKPPKTTRAQKRAVARMFKKNQVKKEKIIALEKNLYCCYLSEEEQELVNEEILK